jgi:hypothetical protein
VRKVGRGIHLLQMSFVDAIRYLSQKDCLVKELLQEPYTGSTRVMTTDPLFDHEPCEYQL